MLTSWLELIKSLGGDAIFLSVAAWLIRELVTHRMDRDIAKYKMELKTDSGRDIETLRGELKLEIEKYKNSLRMIEHEHRVRFSRLHEERARAIARLYSLIVEAESIAKNFVYNNNHSQDMANAARKKVDELYCYFQLHRLYFPNSICTDLDIFISKLSMSVNAIWVYLTSIEYPTEQIKVQQGEKMHEAANALETVLPKVRNLLENEFRTLLGAVDEE